MTRDRESCKTELLELAKTLVLRGIHGPLPKGVVPVDCLDFGDKYPIAWRNSFAAHKATGKPASWHDILDECRTASIEHAMGRWPEASRQEKRLFFLDFEDDVAQALAGIPTGKRILTRICGDTPSLFAIILVWMMLGKPEDDYFASLLHRCLCAGGAPCGWLGKFPKGHLIVYWPYEQEPQLE